MRKRLMLSATVIMVALFSLEAIVSFWMENNRQVSYHRQLAAIVADAYSTTLSSALWNYDPYILESSVKKIVSIPSVEQVTLINNLGEVVVKLGNENPDARYSRITRSLAWEVDGELNNTGTLSISLNENVLDQVIVEQTLEILLVLMATLIIVLVAISLAFRGLTHPLEDITKSLENVTYGPEPRVFPHLNRHDEVGSLARAIQAFSDKAGELYKLLDMLTANAAKRAREVKDARLSLSHLNETKSKFITVMTMQIRSPLTAIRGAVGLCKNGMSEEHQEQTLKLLDVAEKNCLRLEKLITEFSEIFALDDGNLSLKMEPVNAWELINSVISEWFAFAEVKQQTIHFDGNQSLPPVYCDQSRFRQVVDVCLENAIQHCPSRTRIDISLQLDTRYLGVSICDNGPGIPHRLRAILFENANPEKSKLCENFGKGVGLGLAHGLMELMGGEISFETFSEEDQKEGQAYLPTGTTFFIHIPLAKPDST